MKQRQSIEERFWKLVKKTDCCWLWTGAVTGNGYGAIKVSGRMVPVHRVGYEIQCGPISDGMLVCHHCDNTLCVRGEHLFLGVHADNMRDMASKGRGRTAKLTPEDVAVIRQRYAAERILQKQLAAEFGVDRSVISRIVRKVSWQQAGLT